MEPSLARLNRRPAGRIAHNTIKEGNVEWVRVKFLTMFSFSNKLSVTCMFKACLGILFRTDLLKNGLNMMRD